MRLSSNDPVHGGERSILIVDDRKSLRRLMKFALASDALRITTADNGAEADELLSRRTFDLVILDLQMPEMGGLELLGRLRRRGDMVRVIVASADLGEESFLAAVSNGVVGFLRKPFSLRMFRDCVEVHLDDFRRVPGAEGYRAAARMSFGEAADLLESGRQASRSASARRWQPLFRAMARGESPGVQFDHARRILRSDALQAPSGTP